jgi:branched-chain amino acid transport system permease protein
MSTTTPAVSSAKAAAVRAASSLDRRAVIQMVVSGVLLLLALLAVPSLVGSDWIFTFTSVAIYSVVALGFGVLYGRVGMISLGQVALLSVGCWIGARLAYATSMPFPILLLATGAITAVIGVLVGLPALRLSGLYLALITLLLAGATSIVLGQIDFPNGGGGFLGRFSTGALTTETPPVRRPSWGGSDTNFYRYTLIVVALVFLLALAHVAGKPGRAWAAIRESEPSALAAGVNITLYKMWAFALASFVTGIAGCLLAAEIGTPRATTFQTLDSLTLAATALIGGIFTLWGAVVAGVFNQLLPFLFQAQWNVNSTFLLVIFGAGLLQVLLSAPGGLAEQFPKDMANLWRLATRKVPATRQAALGIGSILALIVGIVFLITVSPLLGMLVVILSPILAAYALDH